MDTHGWKPLGANERRYARELAEFIRRFMPWSIQSGQQPGVVLPSPDELALAADAALTIARRMAEAVAKQNATSWRLRAQGTPEGRRIYQALRTEMGSPVGVRVREIIDRQVKLIGQMPDRLARQASRFVAREQLRGLRSSAIAEQLEHKIPGWTRSQIKMLARTEVGRAETALTQARSERLGLHFYEWESSHDQRVRPSHRKVSGVLVAWADPPSPEQLAGEASRFGHYHPGSVPNCRCIALPLVSLNEVAWPHKVYAHGQISYVSRGVFERWIRTPQAA